MRSRSATTSLSHCSASLTVDGCTDPRKSGAEWLNWWGDIGLREALAERHVCDCWMVTALGSDEALRGVRGLTP